MRKSPETFTALIDGLQGHGDKFSIRAASAHIGVTEQCTWRWIKESKVSPEKFSFWRVPAATE
jgi:hypothetical protein